MSEPATVMEREEIRYEIQGRRLAVVSFALSDPRESPPAVSAELINLSQGGVRLSATAALPLGKSIRIRLRVEELALEFYVAAEVCWSRPEGDGTHLVGCRFTPGIPSAMLGRLACGGMIDRRVTARSKDAVQMRLTTEQGDSEKTVVLQNHSPGGFCILVRRPIEPETRLFLTRKGDRQPLLTGRARWQLQASREYLIGCVTEEAGTVRP
jgi:hypothetical protein